ncbi:hypothetical protein D3C71_2123100 [compost metagenome]
MEQALLEYTGATGNQVHRDAYARVHVADDALVGDQLFNASRCGMQQIPDPALHRRLQPYPNLLM